MLSEISLSNGEQAKVRRLGLFELDNVPKDIPGAYTYTVHLLGGDSYDLEYDLNDAIANPPSKPDIPVEDAELGSPEHYQWQEWLRYKNALAHQSKMYEAYAAYCERVADYIKANCLPDDIKIETVDDWQLIYNAALCPQITLEDIKRAMSENFGARWGGKDIFDALATMEGGLGEYISTKVWETDLMIKLGETEAAYTERGVMERARMIAALKIPDFFRMLESDRVSREIKAKRGT